MNTATAAAPPAAAAADPTTWQVRRLIDANNLREAERILNGT